MYLASGSQTGVSDALDLPVDFDEVVHPGWGDVLKRGLDGCGVKVAPAVWVVEDESEIAEILGLGDFQIVEVRAVEDDPLGVAVGPPDALCSTESEVVPGQVTFSFLTL